MIFSLGKLNEQPRVQVVHYAENDLGCEHLYGQQAWHPAKPTAWIGMNLRYRIRAAWYVLTNRAVAVRWF